MGFLYPPLDNFSYLRLYQLQNLILPFTHFVQSLAKLTAEQE